MPTPGTSMATPTPESPEDKPSSSLMLESPDVILVGSGIMSATLAVMLARLDPALRIQVLEASPGLAREASDGWNNSGTGHAGVCELSYTPERDALGRVPIGRALRIFEQFEHSRQFWGGLVAEGILEAPDGFIHPVPHLCFVRGDHDVDFLRARHEAMRGHHFFRGMRLTSDPGEIAAWAPLVMEGRVPGPVGATRGEGTEIDYGRLARGLCGWLSRQGSCGVASGRRVTRLRRDTRGWRVSSRCAATGEECEQTARFVFVGAGGGSLPLLQSAGLPEAAGLGGFPIGGQWLVCDDPELCARHEAKVYGATPPSSPSLGAGHLDLRRMGGRRHLLFGPFASWTTRFLRHTGGRTDLPASIRPGNLPALLRTAVRNRHLVRYLVEQGLQGMESRLDALREFFPAARAGQWRLVEAGIRVQAIHRADRGALHFGTEVLSSADRSVAALLGASPGASVSVNIALEVVRSCLPHLLSAPGGAERMRRLVPTFDQDLSLPVNADLFERTSREAGERLGLSPRP